MGSPEPPATHRHPKGGGSEPRAVPSCTVPCHAAPCCAPRRAAPCHAAPCRAVLVQHPTKGHESTGQDYLARGSRLPKPSGCSAVAPGPGDTVPGAFPHRSRAPGRILTPSIAGDIKSRVEHRGVSRGISLIAARALSAQPASCPTTLGQDPARVRLPAALRVVQSILVPLLHPRSSLPGERGQRC